MKKKYIIPLFIPHIGCPYDCIFCNQKKIAKDYDARNIENLKRDVEKYLSIYPKGNDIEIAFYGGSFTAIKESLMIEYLKLAKEYFDIKLISQVRVSTRPDSISERVLDILKRYNVKTIELGAQSMNDCVLSKIKRCHCKDDTVKASKLIKSRGFILGLQMMVGLYGSSNNDDYKSAVEIAGLNPDFVRIYPTLVIKDTELEEYYNKGLYKPLSVEEAVDICSEIIPVFRLKDIDIIRISLQNTENITMGKDVKAGPFHESFRELCESRIYRNVLDCTLAELGVSDDIIIEAPKDKLSFISGNNKNNRKYIMKKYKIANIHIKSDNTLRGYDFNIIYKGKKNMYSYMDILKNKVGDCIVLK